ncbi:MAG: dihydrolipoamide acetyltransferase [Myxococcales bacterium]|nr:MAG: dihydrolipoamide acetyltransferase [Myxococcales bacterium]
MRAYWLWAVLLAVGALGCLSVAHAEETSSAAPAAPPASPSAAERDPYVATGDEAYELKLRELEEKVNQLKEKIFRSKTRLMLLQETILHGVLAGSKAVITHQNLMAGTHRLESVAYYLDGAPIFGKINLDGSLDGDKRMDIYNGTLQPGNHMLSVYMVYRGSSSVFVYVEGVQVKLKASYTFKAEEGKITKISVVGYDKGGVTAKFEDRPAVKFDTSFADLQETEGALTPPAAQSGQTDQGQ